MPQAINIVVPNAAAVSKTFALAQPASGVSSALWFLREGANVGVFPKLEVSARKNGTSDSRKVQITLSIPYPVTSATGSVTRAAAITFNIDATIPDLTPDSLRDDAIAFFQGVCSNALIKESFKVGFAPT